MVNIEELTLKQIRELTAICGSGPAKSARIEGDKRPVIVRARDAGVHFGKLVAYESRTVWLQDSRRLWSWTAKQGIALSGVAQFGIKADKSKVDGLVPSIVILDACEIIDASEAATKSILEA